MVTLAIPAVFYSNDTKRDISNSSQTSFLVESSSLATSRSSNSISSIQGLSTLFQDRPNEVKTECNETAGSCQVTQKRDPQSAVTAANLVSPSVENVLPVFDDAEQRNVSGSGKFASMVCHRGFPNHIRPVNIKLKSFTKHKN